MSAIVIAHAWVSGMKGRDAYGTWIVESVHDRHIVASLVYPPKDGVASFATGYRTTLLPTDLQPLCFECEVPVFRVSLAGVPKWVSSPSDTTTFLCDSDAELDHRP